MSPFAFTLLPVTEKGLHMTLFFVWPFCLDDILYRLPCHAIMKKCFHYVLSFGRPHMKGIVIFNKS